MQQQRLWASGVNSASPGAHLSQHNHHLHLHHHHRLQHQQNQSLFSDNGGASGSSGISSSNYYVNNNGSYDNNNNNTNQSSPASPLSSSPRHPHLQKHINPNGHQNIAHTTQHSDHYLHHLQPSSHILVHKHQSALQLSSHNNYHHQHQQQQRLKQIASYVEQQVAAAAANSAANLGLTRTLDDPMVTLYHQPQPQAQTLSQTQIMIESPQPLLEPREPTVYMKQAYASEPSCQLNYTTNTTNYLQQQQQQQQQQLPVAAGPRPRVNSVSVGCSTQSHLGPAPTCSLRMSPGFVARSSSFSAPRAASADQRLHYGAQQHPVVTAAASAQPGGPACLRQAPIQLPYGASTTNLAPDTPGPVSPSQGAGVSRVSQAGSPISYHKQQQQQQSPSPISHSSGSHSTTSVGGSAASAAAATMSPSDALNLGINLEQYISKRNERERSRVRNVNDAFDNLKGSLPLDIEKLTKRMSKVEILRTAIGYIRNLENVLGYKPHQQLTVAARTTTVDGESEQQQAPPTRVNSQDSIKSYGSSSLASGSGNEYNSTYLGVPTSSSNSSSSSQPASPQATLMSNYLTPAVSPAISSCGSMSPPLTTTTTTTATTTPAGGATSAKTSAYPGGSRAVQATNHYCHYTQNSHPLDDDSGSGVLPAAPGSVSTAAQPYQQQQQQHEDGPFYYQDLMRLLEQHE